MICYAFQICPPWLLTCTSALPPLGWGAADLHYPPPRQVSPAEICQSYTPSTTAVMLTYTPPPWLVLSPKVGQSYNPLLAFYQTYKPPSPKLLCWLNPPPLLWLVPSPKVGRSYTPLTIYQTNTTPRTPSCYFDLHSSPLAGSSRSRSVIHSQSFIMSLISHKLSTKYAPCSCNC